MAAAVTAAEITVAAMAAAVTAAEITVVAMAAAVTAAEITVAATAAQTLNLIILTLINLPEPMDGKIEVMETLLKTLNMKVEEVGGKEAFQIRVMYLIKIINNPFLQAYKLI